MTPAEPNPRHRRTTIKSTPDLTRWLYEIARPMNLSINDALIWIARGLQTEESGHAHGPEPETSSPGETPT